MLGPFFPGLAPCPGPQARVHAGAPERPRPPARLSCRAARGIPRFCSPASGHGRPPSGFGSLCTSLLLPPSYIGDTVRGGSSRGMRGMIWTWGKVTGESLAGSHNPKPGKLRHAMQCRGRHSQLPCGACGHRSVGVVCTACRAGGIAATGRQGRERLPLASPHLHAACSACQLGSMLATRAWK